VFPGAEAWVIRNNVITAPDRRGVAVRFYKDEPAPGCVFTGNRIDDGILIHPGTRGFKVWRDNVNTKGRALNRE
jgi:hypothetical protein